MKLVELFDIEMKKTIFVHPRHIVSVYSRGRGSSVNLSDGYGLDVKENLDTVIKRWQTAEDEE
jgi:hypothetical protein